MIIFSEQAVTAGTNYTCENVFFFLFALRKNALVNDKTNKAREVNKRGRTRYPLRWAVQNGQSFGFLKQLKRLRNGQKLEKGNGALTAGTSELKRVEKDRDQLERK